MNELHEKEQELLKMLDDSKSKEQQDAIKRTIGRINKEMESQED